MSVKYMHFYTGTENTACGRPRWQVRHATAAPSLVTCPDCLKVAARRAKVGAR